MPDFSFEDACMGIVCGVDEAGRGPWAGPVVAGAAIVNKTLHLAGINDSKQVSKASREALYERLLSEADTAVGIATVQEIDALNILGATKLAMQRAVAGLRTKPLHVLVDGNQPPTFEGMKVQAIVKGDAKSFSIAAASIIAKVTRDRMMEELAAQYPHYGWETNAGYGTKTHQEGLRAHGITPHHRLSFAPIKALLAATEAA